MNIPDHIFNEAIDRLSAGETANQIASSYPDHHEQLVGLLSVAKMGMDIPKLSPPVPYKAFRFANVAATPFTRLYELLSLFRVAIIPISLVIVLLGIPAIASATKNSLPGDRLYSLKRATEQVQLTLTQDQNEVATLHVALIQKRLDEVKKAADTGNTTSETLAIAELKSQTEITFAQAGPIATANAISNQDSSLLDNLVAINIKQKTVLSELSKESGNNDTKTIAGTALLDNKKNDQTLATIIATVNDQILAESPNKVSVTGNVTLSTPHKITVEKNTFVVDDKTVITNSDGTEGDRNTLINRATITGTRTTDGTLLAKQIVILPVAAGTVKGDATIIKPGTWKTPVSTEPKEPPVEEVVPVVDTTKVQGSFMIEPSDPQFAQ